MLKTVVHERFDGTRYEVVDSETYEYTSRSYFRPDIPAGMGRGEDAPIAIAFPYTAIGGSNGFSGEEDTHAEVFLLHTVRGHSAVSEQPGPVIAVHEYDNHRRGVVDATAGEFLRVVYEPPSGGSTVTVYNDSTGSQTEYGISGGHVDSISDDCACSTGTAAIEYYADGPHQGRVKARRRVDADVSDAALGTRTMYVYDDVGRVTFTLENWEDPEVPTDLSFDPLHGPTRVRSYVYAPYATPEPLEVSRVFSAMCPRAEHVFGLACPADWDAENPRTIRDYDALRLTQVSGVGLTLLNAQAGTIERMHRTTEYYYAADGVRLDHTVNPAPSSATEYVYHAGPSSGPLDVGQLHEVLQGGAVVVRYSNYNEWGKPGTVEDENGVITLNSYDALGRLECSQLSYGGISRATCYDYRTDDSVARVEVTDGNGSLAVYTDYSHTYPAELQDPTDAAFCDTQIDLPDAAAVSTAHKQCVAALGHLGRPSAIERGVTEDGTSYKHAVDRYSYDKAGNTTDVVREDWAGETQRRTAYEYDRAGRQIRRFKYTDGRENPSHLSEQYYDGAGNRIATTDERFADVSATRLHNRVMANQVSEYDALGRLTAVAEYTANASDGAAVTLYGYDVHDNLVRVTDADGRVTKYLYDDFGQLVAVRSPDSGETRYAYDTSGNLVQIYRADESLQLNTYDARGRLESEEFDASNQTSALNRYYFYDDIPVQSGSCPQTNVDFYPTFLRGRLAMVQHGAGTTYFSYSAFGEIVAVFEQAGPQLDICNLHVTRYEYDVVGRLTGITYPSGRLVHYEYGAGAMYPTGVELVTDSNITQLLDGIQHDVDGQVTHFAAPNPSGAPDILLDATRDYAGQAVEVKYHNEGGSAKFDWKLRDRDGAGNIRNIKEDAAGKEVVVGYDDLGRVISATGSLMRGYQDCTFDYDFAGNRTEESCYPQRGVSPIDYSYSTSDGEPSNRLGEVSWYADDLLQCGGDQVQVVRSFEVDYMGRATSGHKRKFSLPGDAYSMNYGDDGRIAFVRSGEQSWEYRYNHQGLRLSKRSALGVDTLYRYDTGGHLLAEESQGIVQEYVWLGGNPIAMVRTEGAAGSHVYVVGSDHLGTPMRLWEQASGSVAWAADYEVFGRAWEYLPESPSPPAVSVSIRFPGQIYDEETGLHYNWWRYYDPSTGRYLQPDPLLTAPRVSTGMRSSLGASLAGRSGVISATGGRRVSRFLTFDGGAMSDLPYAYAGNSPLSFIDPEGLRRRGSVTKVSYGDGRSFGQICASAFGQSTSDGLDLIGAIPWCDDPAVWGGQTTCLIECIYADECSLDDPLYDNELYGVNMAYASGG